MVTPIASSSLAPVTGGAGSIRTTKEPDLGLLLAVVCLGLVGIGAVALVLFRPRAGEHDVEPIAHDDQAPSTDRMPTGALDDPLLEAMATTARQRGRPGAAPLAGNTPTPIAAWVKRLDAEVNVMSDLATAPTQPAARRKKAAPGDGASLSA